MQVQYSVHFPQCDEPSYAVALEVADLAFEHGIVETSGGVRTDLHQTPPEELADAWHVVRCWSDQVDLLAFLFKLAQELPPPRLCGVDLPTFHAHLDSAYAGSGSEMDGKIQEAVAKLAAHKPPMYQTLSEFFSDRFFSPWQRNIQRTTRKLLSEGYLRESGSSRGQALEPGIIPKDYHQLYRELKKLVLDRRYAEAIDKYYEIVGDAFYGPFRAEFLYLKTLAGAPLLGRDLVTFRPDLRTNDFIFANAREYCSHIDSVLSQRESEGLPSPLEVLRHHTFTLHSLVECRRHEVTHGAYLTSGPRLPEDIERITPETVGHWTSSIKERGKLFSKFVDQVPICRRIEWVPTPIGKGLWTKYSPSYYQQEVVEKGLEIACIDAYELPGRKTRVTDVETLNSLPQCDPRRRYLHEMRYTGRQHTVKSETFHEIDIFFHNADSAKVLGNPFREMVGQVLWDAENLLRESHGLPRIGEGWISETQLYKLVKSVYPDAQHHASPKWLAPQHLDVLIPSLGIAIEYQGRQHFEPIDFFGGDDALQNTLERDSRKALKCQHNRVRLVHWRYDEPIAEEVLVLKLGV
jgi:hypothetical protein